MTINKKNMYISYVDLWIGKLWNLGDHTGGEVLHDEFTDNRPISQFPNTKEGHIAMAMDWNFHFPDVIFHIKEVIIEKDKLVGRYEAIGTHNNVFLGYSPNGKEVILTGIDIMKFSQNKIIEWHHNEDMLGFIEQLKS